MKHCSALIAAVIVATFLHAAPPSTPTSSPSTPKYDDKVFAGLELRGIGPALVSGRIVDVTVDPRDARVWYLATAAGGVWKTTNAGTTFTPVFDDQNSFSTGCVTIDPNDSLTVWVGSGENNSQRSVSYGDGVYKSTDGGKSWTNVGLAKSEHIGKIIVDPRDSNVVYVAAQGPLWNPGGDRGLYKTTDGGKSWKAVLTISENTGVTDVVFDPTNPDTLYAASYQRRRHVYTLINGGPESAIYKSTDAGATWNKLTKGLPKENMGRIGLAIPKQRPKTVYAIIEAARSSGGFFRSQDGGGNFEKMSKYSGGGAQYYAEIFVDPNVPERVYAMDVYARVSDDSGKTWKKIGETFKHVDNHVIWIDPANSDHVIMGCDGFRSLPDPKDPNIIYGESQYGGLGRFDKRTGELLDIQPQPSGNMDPLRQNWDSPLIVSPHDSKRIYFAAQYLFRSDDRGNTWKPVSGDLTRHLDRNTLPVMGRVWGIDAVAKNVSTSLYGNIVSLSESPLQEGLIYVGTDDGLIQVTEDGGQHWRKIERFPLVPEFTYVSALQASAHDVNTVYAAFDNHKTGDFKPYVYKSTDRGATWKSITSDLPQRGSAYVVIEDTFDKNLLYAGTEFGLFISQNGGGNWIQIKGGLPTIPVRDLQIQKRRDDLVVGTFGRGIYILDDLKPLRSMTPAVANTDATLFAPRDADLYVERAPLGLPNKAFQGDAFFNAPNPPFGAVFTYYIKDELKSLKKQRAEAESRIEKDAGNEPKKQIVVPYPTLDQLRTEDVQRRAALPLDHERERPQRRARVPEESRAPAESGHGRRPRDCRRARARAARPQGPRRDRRPRSETRRASERRRQNPARHRRRPQRRPRPARPSGSRQTVPRRANLQRRKRIHHHISADRDASGVVGNRRKRIRPPPRQTPPHDRSRSRRNRKDAERARRAMDPGTRSDLHATIASEPPSLPGTALPWEARRLGGQEAHPPLSIFAHFPFPVRLVTLRAPASLLQINN